MFFNVVVDAGRVHLILSQQQNVRELKLIEMFWLVKMKTTSN